MITFLYSMLCVWASAQVQVGCVKTIGRPDKQGRPLAGVTLRFRGVVNAVTSAKDGKFSIPVSGKKDGDACYLISVAKKGYEIADRGSLSRGYVVSSSVPIQVVLVSTAELDKERQRIERNAYRVAEKNYNKKKADIEKQLADMAISKEESRMKLEQLEMSYQNYMSLVSDMADRYARTDYDQLDSMDVEINKCIEDGELEKADSLIHTVFDPETVLERNRQAKQEISERKALALQALKRLLEEKSAIVKDIEYAEKMVNASMVLAREYATNGEMDKAMELFQECVEIMRLIYGDDSEKVITIKQEMNLLK